MNGEEETEGIVGVMADRRFMAHETGAHVETPKRLEVIYDMLDAEGFRERTVAVMPRHATEEEVALNHTTRYIWMLKEMPPGRLDADTVISERSFETAMLAAGGSIEMVDAVLEGRIKRSFAFLRPPGHHAERERGMGFCLFNNVAIAARHLIERRSLSRIAVVDWDLHHGNGTQNSFYGEKEVLYISIHQSPCYPGTGMLHEVGEGEGEGFTVNLPIPAGIGDRGYLQAFEEFFRPIILRYEPEIILVSAGFDPHAWDPLGGMEVTSGGFGAMGRVLMETADEVCRSRIAFFLEGGYSLEGLRESAREVLAEMLGERGAQATLPPPGPDIAAVLERARTVQEPYWGKLTG